MSAELELGIERILTNTDFRREAIETTEQMISGDLDPQLYMIVAENGQPAAIEIQNGFFKGTISLSMHESMGLFGTNRGRYATDSSHSQRVGLLYVASPSIQTAGTLGSIAHRRSPTLAFTIFRAVPGGKLAARGQQFAVRWTAVYTGVEISALVRINDTVLMSCTYTKISTTETITDPKLTGRIATETNYENNQSH